MPGSEIPVIRQPFQPGDMLPYWCAGQRINEHYLFDIYNDPAESENLLGTNSEIDMQDLLRTALAELDAPDEQLIRLGLN
jgi:hypothetical protein